jgi:hypothetical protein
MELKLNETHQFVAYADDMTVLGNNINTIKEKTATSIVAMKEVDLEVNTKTT